MSGSQQMISGESCALEHTDCCQYFYKQYILFLGHNSVKEWHKIDNFTTAKTQSNA